MPRAPDSARLDLSEVVRRVQHEMLASLSVGRLFEHASTAGAATEHHWLEMFHRYLPTAYRAAPAFVIDSTGRRSRQIDIAIFDQLHSPQLFPHASGVHVPAESVYAVFEVKPTFSRQWQPFFNTSYVKSGFHLMTVASLAIAAFGAASNAFWMGSVVCATTLVETASAPSTGKLTSTGQPIQVPKPVCVLFVKV